MGKTIRIWNGNRVIQVIDVGEDVGGSTIGAVGGAHSSILVDIEIDPWAGLIVDHSTPNPPMDFRGDEL